MTTEPVTAPLAQLATGLSVTNETCPACERPLRAGTPVVVTLTDHDTTSGWTVATCRCRDCPAPRSASQAPYVLTATLTRVSHTHTQTHELWLADPDPLGPTFDPA